MTFSPWVLAVILCDDIFFVSACCDIVCFRWNIHSRFNHSQHSFILHHLENRMRPISAPHNGWCSWDLNLRTSAYDLPALPLFYGLFNHTTWILFNWLLIMIQEESSFSLPHSLFLLASLTFSLSLSSPHPHPPSLSSLIFWCTEVG